jgi:hypothetical protein
VSNPHRNNGDGDACSEFAADNLIIVAASTFYICGAVFGRLLFLSAL